MKALKKGFLKGCPNINKELVTKYLNPSPATAKGHMKRPKKGIRTTTRKTPPIIPPIAQIANPEVLPIFDKAPPYPGPAYKATNSLAMIENKDKLIANLFCFGAFADKVMVWYTMTSQETSHLCPWMEAYVSL
jgi:hypothetical protein